MWFFFSPFASLPLLTACNSIFEIVFVFQILCSWFFLFLYLSFSLSYISIVFSREPLVFSFSITFISLKIKSDLFFLVDRTKIQKNKCAFVKFVSALTLNWWWDLCKNQNRIETKQNDHNNNNNKPDNNMNRMVYKSSNQRLFVWSQEKMVFEAIY